MLLSATTAKPRTLINFDLSDIEKVMLSRKRSLFAAANACGNNSTFSYMWRYPWSVLRFIENF